MLETQSLTITADASVREALDCLNRTGQGVLLLIDEAARLRRTITDGDLRRLLLGGGGLETRWRALPEQSPITVTEGTNELAKPSEIDKLLSRLLSGGWKAGKIPALWDGRTASRIVASLKKRAR